MKRLFTSLAVILFTYGQICSETTLSGILESTTLTSSGNPYIVEKDIIVPKEKSLIIEKGCVFLFKPFTGFNVLGNLQVTGTQELPVVFSSINDSIYNKNAKDAPNSFDWNGITIDRESGTVGFMQAMLCYSVFGIKSQNREISIISCRFHNNGQFNFTINDKIQNVAENEAFSFNAEKPVTILPNQPQKKSLGLKIIRYSMLGIGVAGSVTGLILSVDATTRYNDLKELTNIEKNGLPAQGVFPQKVTEYNSAKTGAIITDILGFIGLCGFGVTFVF